MSYMTHRNIKITDSHFVEAYFTIERLNNDVNGDPRYKIQVWSWRTISGSLWLPRVDGFRLSKENYYFAKGHDGDGVILNNFIEKFIQSVKQV